MFKCFLGNRTKKASVKGQAEKNDAHMVIKRMERQKGEDETWILSGKCMMLNCVILSSDVNWECYID